MPGPTEHALRVEIVQRHQKGETLCSISEELHLSYETVKKVWRHWHHNGTIEPNYERAKQRGTRRYPAVYEPIVAMKVEHPRWGAQLILLEMQQAHPEKDLPSG